MKISSFFLSWKFREVHGVKNPNVYVAAQTKLAEHDMSSAPPPHLPALSDAHRSLLTASLRARLTATFGDVDDTLLDYVLLIVGGRSRADLAAELDAFFGEQTQPFVEWLWRETETIAVRVRVCVCVCFGDVPGTMRFGIVCVVSERCDRNTRSDLVCSSCLAMRHLNKHSELLQLRLYCTPNFLISDTTTHSNSLHAA